MHIKSLTCLKAFLILLAAAIVINSCMAPRNITNSGKVTPKGNFAVSYNATGNISTQTTSALADVVKENVRALARQDTIHTDENFLMINKAAIAYALDPVNAGTDISVRYGIIPHLDAGIKIAGNAKALDVQYQFLGPVGNINDETAEHFYGSIGLQFSWQKQELPSVMGDIQDRLGYEFKRKDILIPLIFSMSYGNEETIGSLSIGAVANYSHIGYSTLPEDIFTPDNIRLAAIDNDQGYWSFGMFINSRVGYKYAYLVPALSVYWQNYGDFPYLNGTMTNYKGWTFIPSIGIHARIGKNKLNP